MLITRQIKQLILVVFAVIAATVGLAYLDTRAQIISQLYYQNLFKRYVYVLEQAAGQTEVYLQQSLSTVEEFASNVELDSISDLNISDATAVNDAISRFMLSFSEVVYVRIFDGEFFQLLFSNNEDDFVNSTADSVQLKAIDQLVEDDAHVSKLIDLSVGEYSAAMLLLNSTNNTIAYSVRVPSSSPSLEKVIVVYSTFSEAERILSQEQLIDSQERIVTFGNGILLNAIHSINYGTIAENELASSAQLVFDGQFEYMNLQTSGAFATYYYFVPTARFQFPYSLQMAMYAILFVTLLLFSLLIIRVVQDAKIVVRERMRLFQSRLLRILHKRKTLSQQQIDTFIFSEKERIYQKITNGLQDDPTIEQYFEQRWDNLLTALRMTGALSIPAHSDLPHDSADQASRQQVSPAHEEKARAEKNDSNIVESLVEQERVAAVDLAEEIEDISAVEIAGMAMRELEGVPDEKDSLGTIEPEREEEAGVDDLSLSVDDPIGYLDETVGEMTGVEDQLEDLVADIEPLSEIDAEEKRTGVLFKEDLAASSSVRLPDVEEDVPIDANNGLFARAKHLKYDAIIARQSGMYAINPNLHSGAQTDDELRNLIDSIS